MEPLSAFLSLISLLRIFKQERGEDTKADRQAFLDWLAQHKHDELKDFIANTAAARTEVDKILAADHAEMIEKLDDIQKIVATLLSRVDEFRGLSQAIVPDMQLSEQAVSILRQFAESGADQLYYANHGAGNFVLMTLPPNSVGVGFTEPRFIKNDLDDLTHLGLISLAEYNAEGYPIYCLARAGSRYVQTSAKEPSPKTAENQT
jgi:hypothetical protein